MSLNIHNKSARLAWQPDWNERGVIRLYAYVYPGSSHWRAKYITSVKVGEWFEFKLNNVNDAWLFWVGSENELGETVVIDGIKPRFLVKAFPYFGGKSVSPKTIKIEVK